MEKVLYCNGDSFVYGMECISDGSRDPKNKDLAFPAYLSQLLNCSRYINNAHNGATNEFIFRKTILDLTSLETQGQDLSNVFAVIGITSLHRTEVDAKFIENSAPPWVIESLRENDEFPQEYFLNKTMFLNPGNGLNFALHAFAKKVDTEPLKSWLAQYLWTESIQLEAQEARIIALQQFFEFKKIRYLFVNTVVPLERTKFIDINNLRLYNISSDSFYNWALTRYPNERRKKNHFSSVPHEEYASMLFQYINQNNL